MVMNLNLNHKLEVLKLILSFCDPEKKLISNAVIKSHFSYCLRILSKDI